MNRYIVTFTSMVIEAENEDEAIDRASDFKGGGNWEAQELVDPTGNDEAGSCILTGEPGENPDDCSTHDHAGYEHQDIVQGHGEDAP